MKVTRAREFPAAACLLCEEYQQQIPPSLSPSPDEYAGLPVQDPAETSHAEQKPAVERFPARERF